MGGASRLDIAINIASLCRECHTAHHYGQSPTKAELLELVSRREGWTAESIETCIFAMIRSDKHAIAEEIMREHLVPLDDTL